MGSNSLPLILHRVRAVRAAVLGAGRLQRHPDGGVDVNVADGVVEAQGWIGAPVTQVNKPSIKLLP